MRPSFLAQNFIGFRPLLRNFRLRLARTVNIKVLWLLLFVTLLAVVSYRRLSLIKFRSTDVVAYERIPSFVVTRRVRLSGNEKIALIKKIVDKIPLFIPSRDDINRQVSQGFRLLDVNSSITNVDISTSRDPALVEKVVFSYLKRLQITCPKQIRMGRQDDGGWDVCVAGPYNLTKPCLIYSIGMGGEWSFDNMVTTQYGCHDMAYDPTIGKLDHRANPLLWFFNAGLSKYDTMNHKNWRLRTFPTLLVENNHTAATVDVLKMDIEYAEWESLEAILANPSCLKNVKQLMIEFHTREMRVGKHSSVFDHVYYWHLARGIDRLGFKIWNVWNNDLYCIFKSVNTPGLRLNGCFNVYYINVRLL